MSIKSLILLHEPFRPAHMGHWIRTRYFKRYIPKFINDATHNVLDAGCGTGTYSRLLAGMMPEARIRAIDLLKSKDWDEAPQNVSFETGDLRSVDEYEVYDLIVSVDVLEHIPNNTEVMHRLANALRVGGHMYIAVPCESQEMHFFPRSWFMRFQEWEKDEHIGEQHTLEELRGILCDFGLEIVKERYTFTFFGHLAWEIETLMHWGNPAAQRLRVVMMPILKFLGLLDIGLPIGTGNNLIIARKKSAH